MSLSSSTLKLFKNIISGNVISDDQLIELRADIAHALNKGMPSHAPRANKPPQRTASGNIQGRVSQPTTRPTHDDFLGDWQGSGSGGPDGPHGVQEVDAHDSIDYEPTPSEYFDDDFENARKNRQHIADVMKRMF